MKKLIGLFLLLTLLTMPSYAAVTKSVAAVDEWAAVAQNAVREGAEIDVSGNYSTTLHIDIAVTSATAHTGTKIEVEASSKPTGDDNWTTILSIIGPLGTANPEALGGAESAGATVLEVASTTGYEADGTRWVFILDNVVATSELVKLVSHVGNTSVTTLDGTATDHDASDTLYNIAATLIPITITINYSRIRVIYDNTYDSDGSQVHTRCRLSQTTKL